MGSNRVLVVGGGLAGLAATMKLAELGVQVDLLSLTPVKRSHSVCAQGGINSVSDMTRQDGDDEWKHFDDTIYGGDFLQNQPPVKEMSYWAPKVIDLMDRLGVTFNRTPEGFIDRRRFGGTLYKRTAFAGATTGQQLLSPSRCPSSLIRPPGTNYCRHRSYRYFSAGRVSTSTGSSRW